MRTRRQRNADVKLMVGATVAVLLAGGLIAAGIWAATDGGGDDAVCGRLPVGTADGIRNDLETGGPFFLTGGADCSFYLALDEGDIVAYRVEQPDGCTLQIEREVFVCGAEPADVAGLERYPVSIETRDDEDAVIVDLTGIPRPTSTTTT